MFVNSKFKAAERVIRDVVVLSNLAARIKKSKHLRIITVVGVILYNP